MMIIPFSFFKNKKIPAETHENKIKKKKKRKILEIRLVCPVKTCSQLPNNTCGSGKMIEGRSV